MTLEQRITLLAQRIAAEMKAHRLLLNNNATDLSALTTTVKTNLVAAVNELVTKLGALISDSTTTGTSTWSSTKIAAAISAGASSVINDTVTATTSVWSSSKTNTAITSAVAALVASSPAALDTLNELAAAIGNDPNFATTITTALGNRARFDAAQTLTAPQKVQIKANIDAYGNVEIGNYDTDWVTIFNTGLV